jgi:hypothetical protein
LIDAGSPRNAPTGRLHGYLSRDVMSPAELPTPGRSGASGYGVEMTPLDPSADVFALSRAVEQCLGGCGGWPVRAALLVRRS